MRAFQPVDAERQQPTQFLTSVEQQIPDQQTAVGCRALRAMRPGRADAFSLQRLRRRAQIPTHGPRDAPGRGKGGKPFALGAGEVLVGGGSKQWEVGRALLLQRGPRAEAAGAASNTDAAQATPSSSEDTAYMK